MATTTTTDTGIRPEAPISRSIRLFRIALVLTLTAAIASWIIGDTVTRRAIKFGQPDWAPHWFQSFVASARADQLLDKGRLAAAKVAARAALTTKPGDVVAIRTLALAADRKGAKEQAERLMAIGTRWSWRDNLTQEWLFVSLLKAGQFDAAMIHGEALVARGQQQDAVFPIFAALAGNPNSTQSLVAALERGTSWRNAFYQYLRDAPPATRPGLGKLMQQLKHSSIPASRNDAAPLLEAMLAEGQASEAKELWRALFWKHPYPPPSIIDPSFDDLPNAPAQAKNQSIFEWRFDPTAGLYVSPDPVAHSGRVLDIASAGNGHGSLAHQRLVLGPGQWLLTFRLRSEVPNLSSRLRIGLQCAEKGTWLTPLTLLPASREWRFIELPFNVTGDCKSQKLTIQPIGTEAGETIDAWIDDFAVKRLT